MMALRVGKDPFDYINEVKIERSKHAMKRRLQEYTPNSNSIDKLENIDQKYHLIVFSAEWCGDCVAYVPALAKTLAIAKNNMIQAKDIDHDNYRDMGDKMGEGQAQDQDVGKLVRDFILRGSVLGRFANLFVSLPLKVLQEFCGFNAN